MVNTFSLAYDLGQTRRLGKYCMDLELPVTERDIADFIGPVATGLQVGITMVLKNED